MGRFFEKGKLLDGIIAVGDIAAEHAADTNLPANPAAMSRRACYALLNHHTYSNWGGGVVFLDKDFRTVAPDSVNSRSFSFGNTTSNGRTFRDVFVSMATSGNTSTSDVTSPSSRATSNYMHATSAVGELGNIGPTVWSNGEVGSTYDRGTAWWHKAETNRQVINADHADKRLVYLQQGNAVRVIDRLWGYYGSPLVDGSDYTIVNGNTSMRGSASYNATRKEYAYISYRATGGNYTLHLFSGVDFDKHPMPSDAFTQPDVVHTTIDFAFGAWYRNDAESYYHLKPVLVDDGRIFVAVMHAHTNNRLSLYEIVLSDTRDAVVSANEVNFLGLSAAYGAGSGASYYGLRALQSRDGGAVMLVSQYYYYGAGAATFVVDKRRGEYLAVSYNNTAYGVLPVPYGDTGFAMQFAGRVYSNSVSNYLVRTVLRDKTTGKLQVRNHQRYFPSYPYSRGDTNSYWSHAALTQVVDYALLTDQGLTWEASV